MGYVSLGLAPFDITKVRQVFDTTKYFSKIISVRLLSCFHTDGCCFILICIAVSRWVLCHLFCTFVADNKRIIYGTVKKRYNS